MNGSYSPECSDQLHKAHEFVASLKLDQFCEVAATCRSGLPCHPGKHIIGGKDTPGLSYDIADLVNTGFNVLQELVFSDGVTWLARIPLPNNCFQPDECTLSYVAVLRCIKKQSKIPVPEVYYHALKSDPKNTTGTTYLLMERLPGHALPTLEPDDDDNDWNPDHLLSAKKVHEQLTDLIIELGGR